MSTLLKALQKRLQGQGVAPQSQQEETQRLLSAKSGKAGTGQAPKASNVAEQVAIDGAKSSLAGESLKSRIAAFSLDESATQQQAATDLASRKLADKKQLGESALVNQQQAASQQISASEDIQRNQTAANTEMKRTAINNQASQTLAKLSSERGTTLDGLFVDFDSSNKELEFREDAAQLEQIAFLLSLSDKAYLDELDRIGREQMLEDDIKFKEEMTSVVIGENLNRYLEDTKFKEVMDARDRDWNKELVESGAAFKIELGRQAIADEGQRQVVTGVGNAVAAGVDYAAKQKTTKITESSAGGADSTPMGEAATYD